MIILFQFLQDTDSINNMQILPSNTWSTTTLWQTRSHCSPLRRTDTKESGHDTKASFMGRLSVDVRLAEYGENIGSLFITEN